MDSTLNITNYVKIYFWELSSMVMRFVTLFVVIPFLSKDQLIFGVYSICVSLGIFLNYADLGFLKATKKYAAESFIQGDRQSEMEMLGFGTFILFFFSLIISGFFLYFAFSPTILFKDLDADGVYQIAFQLLLIVALTTPFAAPKRLVDMIFKIRLENFLIKKYGFFGSVATILSAVYFFSEDRYMIVSYFLFLKVVDIGVIIFSLFLAKKRYEYNLILLLKSIRFDRNVFIKTYNLAFSGLYITLSWVLFYELDQLAIAKFLGAEKVSLYAVALMFPVLLRQLYGIWFAPFIERANHHVGLGESASLKNLLLKIVLLSAPLTIIPTVALVIVAKPLLITWVGTDYLDSINLAWPLILCYSMAFITYPIDIFLLAKEKIKELYLVATIPIIIFWPGVIITVPIIGVMSFSLLKLTGILILQIFYLPKLMNVLELSFKDFLAKVIIPLVAPVLTLALTLFLILDLLPSEKGKVNFIIVGIITVSSILFTFYLVYLSSKEIQKYSKDYLNRFKKLGVFRKHSF